jgi:hypothetical protein
MISCTFSHRSRAAVARPCLFCENAVIVTYCYVQYISNRIPRLTLRFLPKPTGCVCESGGGHGLKKPGASVRVCHGTVT